MIAFTYSRIEKNLNFRWLFNELCFIVMRMHLIGLLLYLYFLKIMYAKISSVVY